MPLLHHLFKITPFILFFKNLLLKFIEKLIEKLIIKDNNHTRRNRKD
jgi:hypothetical protein